MTASEVKKILGLVPHPREGGCYIRTYESGELLAAASFADGRYSGPRHTATAIYYLLEAGTFSEMHCLRSDEIFHFYAGDAVEMLQLQADGSGRVLRIGNRLAVGSARRLRFRAGVWQGSRLVPGGEWDGAVAETVLRSTCRRGAGVRLPRLHAAGRPGQEPDARPAQSPGGNAQARAALRPGSRGEEIMNRHPSCKTTPEIPPPPAAARLAPKPPA